MNIPPFSLSRLFALLLISMIILTYSGTAVAEKRSSITDTTLVVESLSQSSRNHDETVFAFYNGSKAGQLGYIPSDGEGLPEGPMSFDVNDHGDLAILDQINGRVQIYNQRGVLLHTINVPRTSFQMRFTSRGIVVTEPWAHRDVLEYALDGTLLAKTHLPDTIEWPTDIIEVDASIFVQANNQLHGLDMAGRPQAQGRQRIGFPSRPNSAAWSIVGDLEDNNQSLRIVLQDGNQKNQRKIHLADRRFLTLLDHFNDYQNNLYIVAYLSESLTKNDDPACNPVVVIKVDSQGQYAGAFMDASAGYSGLQMRYFVPAPDGSIYHMVSGTAGTTVDRVLFENLGLTQYRGTPFSNDPTVTVGAPPSEPINARPTPKPFPKRTAPVDHSKPMPNGVAVIQSGGYSGAPPMTRAQIIEIARSAVGSTYIWGGDSWNPFDRSWGGADCSGLVSRAWQVNEAHFTTEELASRPNTTSLVGSSTLWSTISDVNQRQSGDAFVNSGHTFIFDKDDVNGNVWAYEALNAAYPIRYAVRSISTFSLRRRANLDTIGIAGRDKGWIYSDFQDTFNQAGGEAQLGPAFDNGGSFLVHRWTLSPESGYAQDFKGGAGKSVIMHGDSRPGAFLVKGAIYTKYMSISGPGSYLGWPTSNEFDWWNGCFSTKRQNFVGGYITQNCSGTWVSQ